jgi:prevent-host-death family protein
MKTVEVEAAKPDLSTLVDEALSGEDVVLAKEGKPLVRLMPVEPAPDGKKKDRASTLGMLKGKIWMSDDFQRSSSGRHLARLQRYRLKDLLLDTHALVWWMLDSDRLGPRTRAEINATSHAYISPGHR